MLITRRGFMTSILALGVAPAIVRASSLMVVRAPLPEWAANKLVNPVPQWVVNEVEFDDSFDALRRVTTMKFVVQVKRNGFATKTEVGDQGMIWVAPDDGSRIVVADWREVKP